jgi:hypothetical protein
VIYPTRRSAHGLVVVTLGGFGNDLSGVNPNFVRRLTTDGFTTVVIVWTDSWLQSAPGEQAGPARLACRAATAIQWIHDNLYGRLGLAASPRTCGFCVTGNSGGASQAAYALSFYGLGGIIDGAVLTDGPPHAAIAQGCLGVKGYAYDQDSASKIDLSYGYTQGGGPCEQHDQSFAQRWRQDSVDGGGVYFLPKTRVVFLFVSGDPTPGPPHGKAYLAKLRSARSPFVSSDIVRGSVHTITDLRQGRVAVERALLVS